MAEKKYATVDTRQEAKPEMTFGDAAAIFKDIYRTDVSVIDKKRAIKIVANMDTYNGITKAELVSVLKWMHGIKKGATA